MIPMTLYQIATSMGGIVVNGEAGLTISGDMSFDSRHVGAGDLFACLPGRRVDGHDFADQAIAAGATAVLCAADTGHPGVRVPDVLAALSDLARANAAMYTGKVIAITGSNGKTSTKDLLLQILADEMATIATERSFNNELGFPHTVLRLREDTQVLVVEMGARGPGHIRHLASIVTPHIAVVLNVGSAHLGVFGSHQAIVDAKAELVEAMALTGAVILNLDDADVAAMAGRTKAIAVGFSQHHPAFVYADEITVAPDGYPTFTLHHGDETPVKVTLAVVGRHHVTNALAAATAALVAGVSWTTVAANLNGAALLSASRMQTSTRPDGVTVINDAFNASPESVHAALSTLVELAGGNRSVAVLGPMAELGEASASLHDAAGRAAGQLGVGWVITVGDAARDISHGAREAGAATTHVDDRDQVLALLGGLDPGDVILIKGSNSTRLYDTGEEIRAAVTVS